MSFCLEDVLKIVLKGIGVSLLLGGKRALVFPQRHEINTQRHNPVTLAIFLCGLVGKDLVFPQRHKGLAQRHNLMALDNFLCGLVGNM
jgi:hypothetical protein